ncbi:group II intron-encoded protein LtrA [Clostridium pasteurianum DSM 525 = ATCC 6013]|uniref:Group II intron-encoded protein LtrA n=3 Tax=Clostridium pasteurianum TaxID=1501 RepID=A0A0H3J554_CLOPA|nr:group II intron reverse transcriptase/maturase [Clostridium pasteurianum]AJA48222.1 group II intron-encoded protein LtrA [Clostridium pasteurianum DSM 525 = ATCC 6013]AJA52210.1 group II intron-encoded protein LtrA [Clostridium pasteurianum DSM 525 = ATCC 6013]AOZ75480.1 group II intron reverse transcriptase/maturase [Clostridium pasteurianum DSM 525 = ATCC 6013]AOZ79275.1 group II intron reverse transcriptase/maturase [Clostridium pasteurianum]ELP60626.1 RNA-directed DNA polymerase [Clostr
MANAFEEIALQAEKHNKVQTIMHYVNKESLIMEHIKQTSGKAMGIDGVNKETYGEQLEENIDNLLARMKNFSYKPQAVRRTYIPKAGSDKLRPLGIPSYEDKLVQGVMRKILDQIYENKFYDFSYGFREGKSCHDAIREVNQIIMTKRINFIVDADIKGFFDNVDHEWLIKFLEHDIQDKNFLRYTKRFLKAGIIEDMKFYESDKGTPQGGLISPVCANVYLHYVLDMWFGIVVKKHCKGDAYIVRYADDCVCFFQYKKEAESFYKSLIGRLKKFGLELASDKSKIIPFGRFATQNSKDGKTDTFDFLGFTHINGKTRTGKYRLQHRTSRKKLKAKKLKVKEWLKSNIHGKPSDTIKLLNRKIKGHYAYYGISGNYRGLLNFYRFVKVALYKVITRRSQRAYLSWARYQYLLKKHPISEPKIYANIWL